MILNVYYDKTNECPVIIRCPAAPLASSPVTKYGREYHHSRFKILGAVGEEKNLFLDANSMALVKLSRDKCVIKTMTHREYDAKTIASA